MKIKEYLTETTFKDNYKKSDILKVLAIRQSKRRTGINPSEIETEKTLTIISNPEPNLYIVSIKELNVRYAGDATIKRIGRLDILDQKNATLFSASPAPPIKWIVSIK